MPAASELVLLQQQQGLLVLLTCANTRPPPPLQLLPFTASCPASFPHTTLSRVVMRDGHVFAALWEGLGGCQAARHCTSLCYEVLQACLAGTSGGSACAALQAAVGQLDDAFFASEELPDLVRAAGAPLGQSQFAAGAQAAARRERCAHAPVFFNACSDRMRSLRAAKA